MTNKTCKRRTQAQRRAVSRQAVLDSACRLFGEKGYADTSLEQIAVDCGMTIRPIYHYFGNKKALFAAVNEQLESRIVETMKHQPEEGTSAIIANWRDFLDLCDDPGFRRIVLVDGPNILGRERWADSAVYLRARKMFPEQEQDKPQIRYRKALLNRILMGAFTEAALMVAEADDPLLAREQSEQLVRMLFGALPDGVAPSGE